MKDLNRWLQWTFWGSLCVFAVAFSFYLLSLLIPVLLGIIILSGLGNFLMLVYKTRKAAEQAKCRIQNRSRSATRKKKAEIIDAEYEIIDDK